MITVGNLSFLTQNKTFGMAGIKSIASLFVFSVTLASQGHAVPLRCAGVHSGPRPYAAKAAVYHVMTRIFDGGIKGVRRDLPALSPFADTILLSGLHSQTVESMPDGRGGTTVNYFGYWPSDHGSIAPSVGTFADLKILTLAASRRNIRVITDAVPAHFGYQSLDGKGDFVFLGQHYSSLKDMPPEIFRSTGEIQQSDWDTLNRTTNASEMLRLWDVVFAQKRLYGLPGFDHRNPQVRQHLIDSYKHFIDAGVTGFRVDAVLYMDRFFITEFINSLNQYAQVSGQTLTFYLETLLPYDFQMRVFANDILSRVNEKDSVFFLDFPMMYELRRAVDDPRRYGQQYLLRWFEGFYGNRRNLGVQNIQFVPTIVNHDFGFPIDSKGQELLIHAISEMSDGHPPLIFQGTENGSANTHPTDPVKSVNPNGELGAMTKTLSLAMKPYLQSQLTIKVIHDSVIQLERDTDKRNLVMVAAQNDQSEFQVPINAKPQDVRIIYATSGAQLRWNNDQLFARFTGADFVLLEVNHD